MQASQILPQEDPRVCPCCHGDMTPGSMNRLSVMLELAYTAGHQHGRSKTRWLDVLAGAAIASATWALIYLAAVRL